MSIRSIQTELASAVVYRNAINQLEVIDQKYLPYEHLTPEQRSHRASIEAGLYPYLHVLENQKQFAWLCDYAQFEIYWDEVRSWLLAILRAKEILDFIADLEKTSKEKKKQNEDLVRIDWLNQQQAERYVQDLIARVNKLIAEIEKRIKEIREEIKKLHEEIAGLQASREVLVREIQSDTLRLNEMMVRIYRDCAQSKEVTVVDIGGFKLPVPMSVLANRLADHVEARIRSGQPISAEKIQEEKRKIISDYIYENVPKENRDAAGDEGINNAIDKINNDFSRVQNKQEKHEQSENLTTTIIGKERKVEMIDVDIQVKRGILAVKEQDAERLHEVRSDIQGNLKGNKISQEQGIELTKKVEEIEKTFIRSQDEISKSEDLTKYDLDLSDDSNEINNELSPVNKNPVPATSSYNSYMHFLHVKKEHGIEEQQQINSPAKNNKDEKIPVLEKDTVNATEQENKNKIEGSSPPKRKP